MYNVLSHFLRFFHKRRNLLICRISFIKTCQAISITFSFVLQIFFFPVHLYSSLHGTLCNLYSLLFFLVNIEENVSVGTKGESPPSFCNDLGTIYMASLQGRIIDLTTKVWVQSLGTLLGRCQAPKIAQLPSLCLNLNFIKNQFNTFILDSHTHTH